MGKYTPGPWHAFVRPNTQTFAVFGPENDPRTPVVEWMGFDATITGLGANTVEANARLIAAAPELLEALEGLSPRQTGYGPSMDWNAYNEAQRKARAAIAKAHGENHDG